MNLMEKKIKDAVRDAYGQIARSVSDEPIRVVRASCCGPATRRGAAS